MKILPIVQTIHDTIYVRGMENFEIIKKIDDMYTNAWNRLLIVVSIFGLLVPIAIGWLQERKLKLGKKGLSDGIKESKRLSHKMEGHVAHSQAEFSKLVTKNYKQAEIDYIKASKFYCEANEYRYAEYSLTAFIYLWELKINDVDALIVADKTDISRSIDIHKDLGMLRQTNHPPILQFLHQIENCFRTIQL